MFPAPPMPAFPAGHATTATGHLRFEDVTQQGHLTMLAIPPSLAYLWRDVLSQHPGQRSALSQGVLPILTRFTIASHDQRIRVDRPISTRAGFELARDPATERIYMNVWSEVSGASGKLSPHSPPGELALAGTLFAEHTFTRPLGPPEQRRVTRLDVEGYPALPETVYRAPSAESAQELPEGAAWLDELAPDPAHYTFTLDQTDPNQHVNSLVYIRLFVEAVNRRLAASGTSLKLRTRAIDIGYRKPCFAGDQVRAHLRLFSLSEMVGAAGYVAHVSDDKPRCYVRAILGS